MNKYEAFTDGSARNNKRGEGIGAWGFIVYENGKEVYRECGILTETTNNIAEMMAVIKAQEYFLDNKIDAGDVIMDSNLVYRGITEWGDNWKRNNYIKSDKKPVANRELWEVILDHRDRLPFVSYSKTRGHADDARNNAVDSMVQTASLTYKEKLNNV